MPHAEAEPEEHEMGDRPDSFEPRLWCREGLGVAMYFDAMVEARREDVEGEVGE